MSEIMSDMPDRPVREDGAALDEMLRRLTFRSEVFYRGQLCGDWALDVSGSGLVSFHVVLHGRCWLHMPSLAEPLALGAGDVVVFPNDDAHILSAERAHGAPVRGDKSRFEVPLDRAGEGTAIVCGYFIVSPSARRLLLAALPDHLVVRETAAEGARIRRLLDLVFDEARERKIGTAPILDRLADALFLYVIRHCLAQEQGRRGIFAALADPQLRNAVQAIHAAPGERWTLEALAQKAFMSRSTFAERFAAVAGRPPMEYLLEWRMALAQHWLGADELSAAEVAERCGYASEVAFRKAFKRAVGVGPGAWRRGYRGART